MTDLLDTPVADIMTTRIEMVADTIPLSYAAKLLVEKQITGLPVTTELGELVGVLSWADVLRAVREAAGNERRTAPPSDDYYADGTSIVPEAVKLDPGSPDGAALKSAVGAYMSKPISAVGIDGTVRDAARLMKKGGVHRVLVVDDSGNLAGLVSATDIVYLLADHG